MKWISVADKLPEYEKRVLIYSHYKYPENWENPTNKEWHLVEIAILCQKNEYKRYDHWEIETDEGDEPDEYTTILMWMELPEPDHKKGD